MVKFVPLTHGLMRWLDTHGYTVLRSVSDLCDDHPTYIPERVVDVWEYLWNVDAWMENGTEANLLVVRDALTNIRATDLRGVVLLTGELARGTGKKRHVF